MSLPKLRAVDAPAEVASARANKSLPWRTAMLLIIVAGLVAAGCAVMLGLRLRDGMKSRAETTLQRSEAAFLRQLQSAGADLSSLVRVIVDDARVRTTLATPGIDDETILDLLRDMRISTGVSIIGVLEGGRVRTCLGADGLVRADLSGSTLVRDAWEAGRSSGLWALKDELLAVAMAPVRLANDPPRLVMVGRKVGQTELATVGQDMGTTGALTINGRSVAGDESVALQTARLPAGVFALTESNAARARIGIVPDVSPPVRAVWVVRSGGDADQGLALWWLTVGSAAGSTVTALVAVLLLLMSRGDRMTFQG